jgi:segregation and condensation protein B
MAEPDENSRQTPDELEGLSLEDLGAAFARLAAQHDVTSAQTSHDDNAAPNATRDAAARPEPTTSTPAIDNVANVTSAPSAPIDDPSVTPEAIIEGALFIGHPESKSLSEQRLASLMRDVTPDEVEQYIEFLNESYRQADQALRIVRDEHGYRMTIAPEVENVRRSFMGRVREARLNQAAIEVLSLVAYQPGITAQKVQDQRGRDSATLLNQLVSRQLLRIERKPSPEGGRKVPHYFPSERFLVLFGLESLDDLPHVEEGLREGQ